MIINILHSILRLYNSLDTRSKRCLSFDIFGIIFIFGPRKYLLSRWGIGILLSLNIITMIRVKGDDLYENLNDKYYHNQEKTKRLSVI